MIDIQTPLRTAYFNIITAAGLKCFENASVPDNEPTPYVIISAMTGGEDSNKSDNGHKVQTTLDLVTAFDRNDLAGSAQVDAIAGLILAQINSKTVMIIDEGLQVVTTKLLQDVKQNTTTSTQRNYRRVLKYEQLIMEV